MMTHSGKLGRLYTSFILIVTVLCSVPFALADETKAEQQLNDAVKSFEAILQKAADKGLLERKGSETEKAPIEANSQAQQSKPIPIPNPIDTVTTNCAAMSYLDPLDYENVAEFDALFEAKADVKDDRDISGVTRLSMTYLALGLGAEVTSLNEARNDDQAKILSALGRIVEGYPTDRDVKLLKAQQSCSKSAALWGSLAASSIPSLANRPSVDTAPELLTSLLEWPIQLQNLTLTRLATHMSEIGDVAVSERLFGRLSPQSKYGDLPDVYDDSLLYLFALIRQGRNDPRFRPIIEKLAAWDGVYQSRALKFLADHSEATGTPLPKEYSTDLAAVSMQYSGRAESRAATLQVIKHRVKSEQYIDAIDTAKREFATTHSEMQAAVNEIGDGISEKLIAPKPRPRLYALNGYFHDRGFFETYEDNATLTGRVYDTAMDLDMPELAHIVAPDVPEAKRMVEARKAFKMQDYGSVIALLKAHASDYEAGELLADAAIAQGDRETVHEVLALLKASPARQKRHADYALRHGLWGEARDAMKTLPAKSSSQNTQSLSLPEADMPIELVNYMAFPKTDLGTKSLPDSADELNDLLGKVKSDTSLVKDYLSQG